MTKMIALMGKPKAGKDEVAKIIAEYFGGQRVDDGLILRLAAPALFAGVDLRDCFTQAGKSKLVDVCGKPNEVRKLLGDLGQLLEDHFGEFFVAEQTLKRLSTSTAAPILVFPSVRKNQGHFYRSRGAVVIEVDRDVPESPYAFDKFDSTARHDVISNNGTLDDLKMEVARVMSRHLNEHSLAWALGAGQAPRSSQPQVDVREFVANL
jgi:hypothetical protein